MALRTLQDHWDKAAYAAGAAVAEKFLEARLGHTMMQHKIYAFISDGGVQEGISAEVGR